MIVSTIFEVSSIRGWFCSGWNLLEGEKLILSNVVCLYRHHQNLAQAVSGRRRGEGKGVICYAIKGHLVSSAKFFQLNHTTAFFVLVSTSTYTRFVAPYFSIFLWLNLRLHRVNLLNIVNGLIYNYIIFYWVVIL